MAVVLLSQHPVNYQIRKHLSPPLVFALIVLLSASTNAAFVVTTTSITEKCLRTTCCVRRSRNSTTKLHADLVLPNENDNNKRINNLAAEEAELANQLASRSVDLPDEISSSFMQYALSIILGRVSFFTCPIQTDILVYFDSIGHVFPFFFLTSVGITRCP